MYALGIFHRLLAAVLAPAVIFAFGYHELHFLFTHHEDTEQCENHLHPSEPSHCDFCKSDIQVVGNAVFAHPANDYALFPVRQFTRVIQLYVSNSHSDILLRGPPVSA
ncbi:MAG: hypothetical protein NZM35_07035 [Chitinophagales bacterium]|nr:hypothetical protein [Chitinophagales bacterium]MDW8419238.1 hypothetical protein [Chitinophagales bacterium]